MKKNFKWLLLAAFAIGSISLSSCKKDNKDNPDDGKIDPSTIATANLVAYMPFDGEATDMKGNRTISQKGISNVNYIAGRRNLAYQGKIGSGFIYALPAGDRIAKAKGITFAMWMKSPAPTGGSPALFQINGTTGDWDMPGSFNCQFQDATQLVDSLGYKLYLFNTATEWKGQWSDLFSTPKFPSNKWFHFVFMYDNATSSYKAYSNGDLVYENVRFAGPEVDGVQPLLGDMVLPADANKLYVGAWWKLLEGIDADEWAQFYVGAFDELRIYDKGLTDDEVKKLFQAEVTQLNND